MEKLHSFRYWCQKVLPLVYDDSLSYYELLCKVVDYLNKTMEHVNNLSDEFESLQNDFNALRNYVNTYFENLDVQEEINKKLDEMTESGVLTNLIKAYVDPIYTEYETRVDGRLSEQDESISVLVSRMDTFASLPPGSTSGNAELLDIRVGADGVTYDSAGNAVRTQFKNVTDDVANVENGVNYLKKETVTDGSTLHATGVTISLDRSIYVRISTVPEGYYNVILTQNGIDRLFVGEVKILANRSHVFALPYSVLQLYGKDYGFDGVWALTIKNSSNSSKYNYGVYYNLNELINGIDSRLTKYIADNEPPIGYAVNNTVYLEKDVQVTDGERGYRTSTVLDLAYPVYITITPKNTNTFNIFLTHGNTEVQFFTAHTIEGGKSYTWELNREYVESVANMFGTAAFDDTWRLNIRNSTNSTDYRYTIFVKDDERIVSNGSVIVSNGNRKATFSKISTACNYLRAKYGQTPCSVIVKNGVYTEEPTNDFPYAPINIADSQISIIGESRDNVVVNLTNNSTKQSRIMHIGGNQTVANMTMNVLADSTYTGGSPNNPYVIHNDDTYNDFVGHYTTTVENCRLYSECANPIGAGLHGNQTQIYRNVETVWNGNYDSTNGSAYIHGASNTGQVPDGLVIEDCTFISKNATKALALPSISGYTPYTVTPVTIRRTILATNGTEEVAADFKQTHNLTFDSKLNSNALLNY